MYNQSVEQVSSESKSGGKLRANKATTPATGVQSKLTPVYRAQIYEVTSNLGVLRVTELTSDSRLGSQYYSSGYLLCSG